MLPTSYTSSSKTACVLLTDVSRFSDSDLTSLEHRLSPSERTRYERFARKERQRQFLVGRILLRFGVSKMTGLSMSSIDVVERPDGPPSVILPSTMGNVPGYSLSHSGKWVACAIGSDCVLGVDIEIIDAERNVPGISHAIFGSEEAAWLEQLPEPDRIARFYHLWSLREALFKLFSNMGCEARFPAWLDAGKRITSAGNGWNSYVLAVPGLSCVLCSDGVLSLLPISSPVIVAREALLME